MNQEKEDNKVKTIEKEYNINIVYRDEVNIDNDYFSTNTLNNDYMIDKSIDDISNVLKKFNKEFFDSFHDEVHHGLIINLAGNLIPKEGANTAAGPVGYTIYDNDEYEIVLNGMVSGIESNMCHELMHVIDSKMDYILFNEWQDFNPYYFEYAFSYLDSVDNRFTMLENDPKLVHFVDTYSKSYPAEDYARVFENICGKDSDSPLKKYPHLYDKALYLKDKLTSFFPSLKEASVFNSLN